MLSKLLALCALLPLAAAAQPQQINGRAFVMNGGFVYPAPVQTVDTAVLATGDLLRLADGSELHGELKAINAGSTNASTPQTQVLVWSHPDVDHPIEFRSENVDIVRFAGAQTMSIPATCRIRFFNGDEFPADITSMTWDQVGVKTWFGGAVTIPRSAIQSITFLPKAFSSGYEGPFNIQGWFITPLNAWRFKDGVFISRGYGALTRDVQLSGSCTVEFDLSCASRYHLVVGLYLEKDQVEYSPNSYQIELSSGTVALHRSSPTAGPADMGSATLPPPAQKSRTHLTIQCNQAEKTLTILADNKLVRRWKDEIGFVGKGAKISFSDLSALAGVCLSDFRISKWEGNEPEVTSAAQTNSDSLWFANRDRASGKITGLADGKVEFAFGDRKLQIPVERITKLEFAPTKAPEPLPGEVRAKMPGGTRLSVVLGEWSATGVAVRSDSLGSLILKPSTIRELKFNPGRVETDPAVAAGDDFGGMDD